MDNTPEQKEHARAQAAEQAGQLEAALAIYHRLGQEAGTDPSAARPWLLAAELELRLGQTEAAVASLERAVEVQRAAGLVNNAIALCQRILRAEPRHLPGYLTLARIAAGRRYLADARAAYLQYAERAEQAGDGEAALLALRELATHLPDDAEVRDLLAARGEDVDAVTLLDTLPEVEPRTERPAAEPAPETEVPRLEGLEEREEVRLLPAEPLPARDRSQTEAEGVAPLVGLETTHYFDETDTGGAPEGGARDEEGVDALPLLGTDADLVPPWEPPPAGAAADEPLPPLGDGPVEELAPTPAPTAPGDELDALRERVEEAARHGRHDDLVAAHLALAERLALEGDSAKALAVYQQVLEIDPDNDAARAALPPGIPTRPREYVDLGALILGDELPGEESTRFLAAAQPPSDDEDRDLTEVLNTFREQVSEKLDRNDAASHYDLGLAFKDMGLLDDAIGQLQMALRGGADLLPTLEVLGECYLEKGETELASRVLRRATQLAGATEVDLVGVHYWLARSAELRGDAADAASFYQRVLAIDSGFRDAARRLVALPPAPDGGSAAF